MNIDDLNAETEMNYKQIISLITLMMENNNQEQENLLTLRDLAEYGQKINQKRLKQATKLE